MDESSTAEQGTPAGRRARRTGVLRWARAAGIGLAAPAAATLIALALPHAGIASAACLYLLATAGAAVASGPVAGTIAAAGGFLGLNYFFTPPEHTFKVRSADDAIALVVYLVVAALVGALVARVTAERERAARREREARSMHRVASAFLSPGPLERIVGDLAATLAEVLSLERTEIRAVVSDRPITVRHPAPRPGVHDEGDASRRFELPLTTASGSYGTLVAYATPGRWPPTAEELGLARAVAGQIAAALELAELDERVSRAKTEVDASAARAALFSSVTHDLRTPLASIKASVTSLLDHEGRYDERQREELLGTILQESDRLNRLVGNILDLARLRAGALTPDRVQVDVEDVIGSVLARMRPSLRERNVRTLLRPDLPAVALDPTQIDQVLTNVIENAARFSPPGGTIVISASRWESFVEIRVSDDGPGIPADERERVFQEFYRKDRGEGRGGTGLGLAIARAIVEAHGGRIWAEGSPTGGAVIAFRLPAAAATVERAGTGTVRP
jgi:two-component system sensor histidine kinase KdpD